MSLNLFSGIKRRKQYKILKQKINMGITITLKDIENVPINYRVKKLVKMK